MPLTSTLIHARQIIETQLQLLWSNTLPCDQIAPLMLWSAPGLGKSQLVRDLCAETGIDFIDVRLAELDPLDIRGMPTPRGDTLQWLIPDLWPRDPASRGILLLDELPAADRAVQVAAYELLLDRRLGELYTLPNGWLVVAAGNRIEDQAVSFPMSSALANRFLHVELEADIEAWTRYAVSRRLHHDIIAFLRLKPDYLLDHGDNAQRGWPSPRTWERVSHLFTAKTDLDDITLRLMVQGLIGEAATTEFMAFRESTQHRVDIPAMLRREVPVELPERSDQQLAFVAAMVHYLWHGDEAMQFTRLSVFLEVGLHLGSDLATLMLIDGLRHEDDAISHQRAEQVFGHPAFPAWLECHGLPMEEILEAPDADLPEGRFSLFGEPPLDDDVADKGAAQGGRQ